MGWSLAGSWQKSKAICCEGHHFGKREGHWPKGKSYGEEGPLYWLGALVPFNWAHFTFSFIKRITTIVLLCQCILVGSAQEEGEEGPNVWGIRTGSPTHVQTKQKWSSKSPSGSGGEILPGRAFSGRADWTLRSIWWLRWPFSKSTPSSFVWWLITSIGDLFINTIWTNSLT